MSTDFFSSIQLAEVDNVRADGSIVIRLTDGNYALLSPDQVDVAKIASDSERPKRTLKGAPNLAVVR